MLNSIQPIARRKAMLFVVLTALLTYLAPMHLLREVGGVMWAPGIAAIITQLLIERRFSGLRWRLPGWRWWLAALVFPLLYVSLAYGLAWISGAAQLRPDALGWIRELLQQGAGLSSLPDWALLPVLILALCTLGVAMNLFSSLGEEIGWRGLLQPALEQLIGAPRAILMTGLTWAMWHWHLILGQGYNAGADPIYSLSMFTLMIVALSIGIGWLTWRTRSIWPAVVVHSLHNIMIQEVFEPLTVRPVDGQWVTSEWGFALPVAIALVLLAAATRVRRQPQPGPPSAEQSSRNV